MEYSDETYYATRCVVWNFHVNNDGDSLDTKEKSRRKKVKEGLGATVKDTPMLDSKLTKHGQKEFCDAIVYTDNIVAWEKAFTENYEEKGFTSIRKDISGGFQLQWRKGESIHVSITFYRSKFMAQPGEESIIEWIKTFSQLKANLFSVENLDDTSRGEIRPPLQTPLVLLVLALKAKQGKALIMTLRISGLSWICLISGMTMVMMRLPY